MTKFVYRSWLRGCSSGDWAHVSVYGVATWRDSEIVWLIFSKYWLYKDLIHQNFFLRHAMKTHSDQSLSLMFNTHTHTHSNSIHKISTSLWQKYYHLRTLSTPSQHQRSNGIGTSTEDYTILRTLTFLEHKEVCGIERRVICEPVDLIYECMSHFTRITPNTERFGWTMRRKLQLWFDGDQWTSLDCLSRRRNEILQLRLWDGYFEAYSNMSWLSGAEPVRGVGVRRAKREFWSYHYIITQIYMNITRIAHSYHKNTHSNITNFDDDIETLVWSDTSCSNSGWRLRWNMLCSLSLGLIEQLWNDEIVEINLITSRLRLRGDFDYWRNHALQNTNQATAFAKVVARACASSCDQCGSRANDRSCCSWGFQSTPETCVCVWEYQSKNDELTQEKSTRFYTTLEQVEK